MLGAKILNRKWPVESGSLPTKNLNTSTRICANATQEIVENIIETLANVIWGHGFVSISCYQSPPIADFCAQQRQWLEQELESASDEASVDAASFNKRRSGPSGDKSRNDDDQEGIRTGVLSRLDALDISVGLYGRTVVRLGLESGTLLLPAHRFTTGDEVQIRSSSNNSKNQQQGVGGVVSQVTETSLSVTLTTIALGRWPNSSIHPTLKR